MKLPLTYLIACAAGYLVAFATLSAADDPRKADLSKVKGKRVAILVTDGFEQVEMTGPRKALDDAGAKTGTRRSDARCRALGKAVPAA